jgi:hypothetical protein
MKGANIKLRSRAAGKKPMAAGKIRRLAKAIRRIAKILSSKSAMFQNQANLEDPEQMKDVLAQLSAMMDTPEIHDIENETPETTELEEVEQ